ncbi:MAG: BspA family leucine-rich repeat surface protein [Bacteroidales bacterium]|nr:BspA family leucine-rich repeat surface protein [Bacteroidales bacterium]
MKKVLFACLALLLVAAGCEKENGKISTDKNGITTIQAVISDLDQTRAHLDPSLYKQVWEEGDEISVFDGVSNVKFTLTSGAGTAIGSFASEATLATADAYYAVYPYETTTTLNGESLTVTFPHELTLDPATGCTKGGGNIMAAKSAGSTFEFKNASSFIKLDLTGSEKLETISIVCKEVESLAGTWKFTISDTGLDGSFTRSATCLKVDCGEGLQLPATVCIPVPPTVTDGFVLYATNTNGLSARAQATTSEPISYNKVVEMPALNLVCDKTYIEGMNFNKAVKSAASGTFVTNTGDYDSTIVKIVFLANQNMEGATGIPVGAGNDRSAVASLDGGTLTVRTAAPKYHVNLRYLFSYFSGLEEIEGLDLFDTEISNSMYYTFGHCHNLKSVDLSHFNTENVTTMQYAFNACWKLEAIDCSSFNTSKVTSMNQMFRQCFVADPINVSSFTSESLKNTYYMFYACEKAKSLTFNENFTCDNVTIASYMFYRCASIEDLDLSHFSLSKDTTFCSMFRSCPSLRSVNLSGFNTSSASGRASYMFNMNDDNTTAIREITLGPQFNWFDKACTVNYLWMNPAKLTATKEDPVVVKCNLNFAQGAVKKNQTYLLTPLNDGRLILKNLQGHEYLYSDEKGSITKTTVLTDPDA